GKVDHLLGGHFRPRIGTHGDFCAKTTFAQPDAVSTAGVNVVGYKLVVSLKVITRHIEIDGAVLTVRMFSDDLNGFFMSLQQRWQFLGDEWQFNDLSECLISQSRDQLVRKRSILVGF